MPYTSVTNDNIKSAIALWVSDEALALVTYGDIKFWDLTGVTILGSPTNATAFVPSTFNADISRWNVSNVTTMQCLFYNASVFNADISNWNVSNVTNMFQMFHSASSFNVDISRWDVSKVTNMNGMFVHAYAFNQNIGGWNVGSISSSSGLNWFVYNATAFNQDLTAWNTEAFLSTIPGSFSGGTNTLSSTFLPVWGTWPATKASMFSIQCSNGVLSPTFTSAIYNNYTILFTALPITITPFAIPGTSVTVNGTAVTSGSSSTQLSSTTQITISVTSRDNSSYVTYVFAVVKRFFYCHTFFTISPTDPTAMTRTTYDNTGLQIETINISFGGKKVSDVLSLMDGGGTNPYTIGIVDSDLNKICMDVAYAGVYTKSLTQIQQSKLMTHVNTTFLEPHTYMTKITVTVSDGLFVLKNQANVVMTYPISLSEGSVYIFDQSDASNRGSQSLVFSSTQMSKTALVGVTTTASGTPGYDTNAYTVISTTTAVAAAYTYTGMIYFMSVVTNNVGNLVFAVSTTGQSGQYSTQLDLSFGAGTKVTFDVSHPSIANIYVLKFGTVRNGVPDESNIVVTRTTSRVKLAIPAAYTGANIYYYSDLPIVSAYETPTIK